MKKLIALLLMVMMAVACLPAAYADTIAWTQDDIENAAVQKPAFTGNNPVIEGEDPFTGLSDNGEAYTPVLLVIDNNTEGYPHWGVGSASVMLQIPNMSTGNTKILALFSSAFPELAGGSRSARMTALTFAPAFGSAFASANYGPPQSAVDAGGINTAVQFDQWRIRWGLLAQTSKDSANRKWFDLLGGGSYKHRVNVAEVNGVYDASLVAHMQEIHELLIKNGVAFEKRPFLFTDTPLDRGATANEVDVKFYESRNSSTSNVASNCTFYYDEGMGYSRENAAGIEIDRVSKDILYFSNLIVLRAPVKSANGYLYWVDNMVGGGIADIFQNGHYIQGTWYREDDTSRIIFMDDQGNELQFQRGKTFIIASDERVVVSYE